MTDCNYATAYNQPVDFSSTSVLAEMTEYCVAESSPQDSGIDDGTRCSSVEDQTLFFGDQWLHHQMDLSEKLHTDLLLVLDDGEEIHLHSAIVLPHTEALVQLLGTSEDQVPTVLLSQVDRVTVLQMVDLLYTGECCCNYNDFHKLNHLLNSLGFKQLLKCLTLPETKTWPDSLNLESDVDMEAQEDTVDNEEVVFLKEIFSGALEELFTVSSTCDTKLNLFCKEISDSEKWIPMLSQEGGALMNILGIDNKVDKSGKTVTLSKKFERNSDIRKPKLLRSCDKCELRFDTENKLKIHKNVQCESSKVVKKYKSEKQVKGGILNRKSDYESILEMKSLLVKDRNTEMISSPTRLVSTAGSRPSLPISTRKLKAKSLKCPRKARSLPDSPLEKEGRKAAPKPLASREVVHSRNNIRWAVEQEKYDDADASWVKKQSIMDLMEFEDLTEGEKAFYCVWNQFLMDHRPGVSRVHLRTVLEEFVDLCGREVRDQSLYRQFVAHLVMLEREGLVTPVTMLGTVQRLQKHIQEYVM